LIVILSNKSLLMVLSTFSMFLLQVNLLICLLSHCILLSGLLLLNWTFTIFMFILRGVDIDIIFFILFYYYQIFYFMMIHNRLSFFSYIMIFCTLYIGQISNKFSLSYFSSNTSYRYLWIFFPFSLLIHI